MKTNRTFGNGRAHIRLTDKAFEVYSNTDPVEICENEFEDESGELTYTYDIAGAFEAQDLTEEEVNSLLESEYTPVFVVRDKEAGNVIDEFESYEDALAAIEQYESIDREEGTFTPDFYEVIEQL